jgi:hypothetical protein
MERREFAFDDMKIGAAHTTGEHFQKHVAGLRFERRNFFDVERKF